MKARSLKLLTGILLIAWIGGCNTPQPPTLDATTEAPNPIQLSTRIMDHTVHFALGKVIPDAGETASLNDFLQTSEAMRGDPVTIERNHLRTDDKRVERLVSALTHQGLAPTVIVAAEIPAGELHLVIERTVATAVNCPNWSKPPGNDFGNTLHSDFGCATAANLTAMIADPHDLVAGRAMGPETGDIALAPIHRYRTGKIPALVSDGSPSPSATAAAASPAGQ